MQLKTPGPSTKISNWYKPQTTSLNNFLFFLLLPLLLSGCLAKTVYYSDPPNSAALLRTSAFSLERFTGRQANLFRDIFIQEIYRIPNFDYLDEVSETQREYTALVASEVEIFSVRDEEETR